MRHNPPMADLFQMAQVRRARGLALPDVAEAVGCDSSNLAKIERGEQTPKRPLARKLWAYYGGAVSLASIYDPEFAASHGTRV